MSACGCDDISGVCTCPTAGGCKSSIGRDNSLCAMIQEIGRFCEALIPELCDKEPPPPQLAALVEQRLQRSIGDLRGIVTILFQGDNVLARDAAEGVSPQQRDELEAIKRSLARTQRRLKREGVEIKLPPLALEAA